MHGGVLAEILTHPAGVSGVGNLPLMSALVAPNQPRLEPRLMTTSTRKPKQLLTRRSLDGLCRREFTPVSAGEEIAMTDAVYNDASDASTFFAVDDVDTRAGPRVSLTDSTVPRCPMSLVGGNDCAAYEPTSCVCTCCCVCRGAG